MGYWTFPLNVEKTRELAVRFARYAASNAPTIHAPVYKLVTEGRDPGVVKGADGKLHSPYSSCADLAHWMLYRLGVRLPFVNRKENGKWLVGLNVNKLMWNSLSEQLTSASELLPGDIAGVWSLPSTADAHVFVVLEHAPSTHFTSGDFGQPAGKVCSWDVTHVGQNIDPKKRLPPAAIGDFRGHRKLQRYLSLPRVISLAAQDGKLADPDLSLFNPPPLPPRSQV